MKPALQAQASTATARTPRRPREDDDAFLARLEAIAAAAKGSPAALTLSAPDARRLVELARSLARGRGADDVKIGEGLAALRQHDMKLGYNGIGDLALDRLGIDPPHARWLAGMAEKLAVRPLLRGAVVAGELSLRKADAVVDVAVGEKEAYWVGRAKLETVRELERLTKPGADPYDQGWRDVLARLEDPIHREHVEHAFAVASVVLGDLDAPKWKIIQALSMEFLGGYPLPLAAWEERPSDVARGGASTPPATPSTSPAAAGDAAPPPAPPAPAWPRPKPARLLRELERLVKARLPDDERLGRAIELVRCFRAWKLCRVARCFEAFCVEVLGLSPATARQRMTLERNLRRLPPLREALRTGRLSYEQARAVAKVAKLEDVEERIEKAAGKPALDTKREVQAEQDRQMWREGKVQARVPPDVNDVFAKAVLSARLRTGPGLSAGQAFFLLSVHFTDVWGDYARVLMKNADKVMKRDCGRCQIPGCSHRACHLHHVRFRSRGGTDEAWNLIAVCEAHHLAGIHQGYIVVTGTAPDGLVWEFPERDELDLALLDPDDPGEAEAATGAEARQAA